MSKRAGLPQSLPFLPGNVAQDPTITHFHKAQIFNVSKYNISGKLGLEDRGEQIRRCRGGLRLKIVTERWNSHSIRCNYQTLDASKEISPE